MPAKALPSITSLRTMDQFQGENTHAFPSPSSLEWFVKRNRPAIRAARAIVVINGRRFIDPDKFVGVVLKVGAERAARA